MHTFKYFRCTCLNPKLWPQPNVIRGTGLFWKLYCTLFKGGGGRGQYCFHFVLPRINSPINIRKFSQKNSLIECEYFELLNFKVVNIRISLSPDFLMFQTSQFKTTYLRSLKSHRSCAILYKSHRTYRIFHYKTLEVKFALHKIENCLWSGEGKNTYIILIPYLTDCSLIEPSRNFRRQVVSFPFSPEDVYIFEHDPQSVAIKCHGICRGPLCRNDSRTFRYIVI